MADTKTTTSSSQKASSEDTSMYLVNKHGRVVHINRDRAKAMLSSKGSAYKEATSEQIAEFKKKHSSKK